VGKKILFFFFYFFYFFALNRRIMNLADNDTDCTSELNKSIKVFFSFSLLIGERDLFIFSFFLSFFLSSLPDISPLRDTCKEMMQRKRNFCMRLIFVVPPLPPFFLSFSFPQWSCYFAFVISS